MLFTNLCVVAAMQLVMVKLRVFFFYFYFYFFFERASEHLDITPLTGKFVKTCTKSAIFDHMLLDGHKPSFDNFLILLKESNAFKLQLKESLLILRDKLIFNKNIYWFPLKLFDWLQHYYFYYIYCYLYIHCQYIIISLKLWSQWNCNHGEIATVWQCF